MAQKHASIKRITHRILEELEATRRIAKIMSWKEAFTTLQAKFDIQVMNRNGYHESEKQKEHLLKKHEVILKYYEKTFANFLNTYDYNQNRETNQPKSSYSDCIWVCWWQGLDQAPEIVKVCLESIKQNAGKHPVILLTEDNYKQYVYMPEWVEKKRESGIISRTHYSDILRLTLLSQYGGMWLDSTFFCTNNVIESYFEKPLWSIKRPEYGHASVASGYFANYSLACDSEHKWVFKIILDFVLEYWKNNDIMIDYLFLDYLIVLAQKYDQNIANAFQNIEPNNPECDELYKIMSQPFDEVKWDRMKRNTCLFKLSWKYSYPVEKDGKTTFYGKLLEKGL